MSRALILADDLTGALDSGVQLAGSGVRTVVYIDSSKIDFENNTSDVIVINTESRHMTEPAAAEKISFLVKAAQNAQIEKIYKKTDSVLRGNVGTELAAAASESGKDLYFVPAYPLAGRTTRCGIQYLDEIPVDETTFAEDPFSPVKTAKIADMFKDSPVDFQVQTAGELQNAGEISNSSRCNSRKIIAVDAWTENDMLQAARTLKELKAEMLAGCAGMAYYLPYIWDLPRYHISINPGSSDLVVISGSVSPVTISQISRARNRGFPVLTLSAAQKLDQDYISGQAGEDFSRQVRNLCARQHKVILEAADSSGWGKPELSGDDSVSTRQVVADNIARIAVRLMQDLPDAVFFLIGGDTLSAVMHQLGTVNLYPQMEISTGVVLSRINHPDKGPFLISKSGGLGSPDVLADVGQFLKTNEITVAEKKEQANETRRY